MNTSFKQLLLSNGWTEIMRGIKYRKGNWEALADTSSWWEISTGPGSRIFDIPDPIESYEKWTLNLIEYLCKINDEKSHLRKGLEEIQGSTNDIQTKVFAKKILDEYGTVS